MEKLKVQLQLQNHPGYPVVHLQLLHQVIQLYHQVQDLPPHHLPDQVNTHRQIQVPIQLQCQPGYPAVHLQLLHQVTLIIITKCKTFLHTICQAKWISIVRSKCNSNFNTQYKTFIHTICQCISIIRSKFISNFSTNLDTWQYTYLKGRTAYDMSTDKHVFAIAFISNNVND